MILKKGQGIIFAVNAFYLLLSLILFSSRKNYEFVMYVVVIVALIVLILATNKRVNYPNSVLWGMTLWGIMHMAGGSIRVSSEKILYQVILIPISESYQIFKYDQLVHMVGFFVSTLLMYALLRPYITKDSYKYASFGIVIVMAGLGVGALNEIVEFIATVVTPETGVGGYINTSLDLVADLIGAILAYFYIKIRKGKI